MTPPHLLKWCDWKGFITQPATFYGWWPTTVSVDTTRRTTTPIASTRSDEWDTGSGNRVATMLLYLTDVALGGATAFTHLKLAVKPRRGSALFWYDLAPYSGNDGPIHFSFWHQRKTLEVLTNHVGCPVLWGTKWIATKWIRERNIVVVRFDYPG
ncbi:hypothetical protein HPB51_023954 [Rhipicephalus microplus]|uniref:Prolyl 4-hydroxylase alpha subunit Fe(2+) 2OG dioxygenase domain-containing protein n=1 Tax=Rhipicephalus microplus TaxID=6941 RepID=A0A9J6EUI1_RHIMP|nr:hypothetical protein HPB51_023954 [Rhipicephalus microplus]